MMRFAGKSDKGLLRSRNEDAYCIIGGSEGYPLLLAVADGMGGHLAGDVASQTVVSVIRESLAQKPVDATNKDTLNARLLEIVRVANSVVYKKSLTEINCYGMGTTLIIAVVSDGKLAVAHIGDSCAYYFRDGAINKITTDHTYVEELIRIGTLTRDEAARHPKRNVLTKTVGCEENFEADLYWIDLNEGDRVLLCTDGLSKMLSEQEIAEAVMSSGDPGAICDALIARSIGRGGFDNITVIVYTNEAE